LNKNTVLTANSFDGNRAGTKRPAYHQSNPGLEIDGPVVIPHIYNGRNKTFFMWSYEIWRSAIPTPSTRRCRTRRPWPGISTPRCKATASRSPSTTRPPRRRRGRPPSRTFGNHFRRHYSSQPHEPGGVKIASYIPAPTLPGATNNFVVGNNPRTDAYDAHVIRIDQQINDKNRFFSRFVRGFRTETNGNYGWQQVAATGTPTPTGA